MCNNKKKIFQTAQYTHLLKSISLHIQTAHKVMYNVIKKIHF